MLLAFSLYKGDTLEKFGDILFPFLQLHCCGYYSYRDWENVLNNTSSNGTSMDVPESCCEPKLEPMYDFCAMMYEDGCISRLSIIVHRSALYIGTGAVAIALIQVSVIPFQLSLYW